MMELHDLKYIAKELLVEDDDKTIAFLEENLYQDSDKFNDLILIKSNFKSVKRDFDKGVLSRDAYDLKIASIRNSILNLINSLKKSDIQSKFEQKQNIVDKLPKKAKSLKFVYSAIIGILGVFIIGYIMINEYDGNRNLIYDEDILRIGSVFASSGWMSEDGKPENSIDVIRRKYNDKECLSFNLTFNNNSWLGIYWQYPNQNWGEELGLNLYKYKKITFSASSTDYAKVEFKAGGIKNLKRPYRDSFEKSLGLIQLQPGWKKYTINLEEYNLSNVIGGFAWFASKEYNKNNTSFFLSEMYYEK